MAVRIAKGTAFACPHCGSGVEFLGEVPAYYHPEDYRCDCGAVLERVDDGAPAGTAAAVPARTREGMAARLVALLQAGPAPVREIGTRLGWQTCTVERAARRAHAAGVIEYAGRARRSDWPRRDCVIWRLQEAS